MPRAKKETPQSKAISVRLRSSLLEQLKTYAEVQGLPWQTYWQNLTEWALAEVKAEKARVPPDLSRKAPMGRPTKPEPKVKRTHPKVEPVVQPEPTPVVVSPKPPMKDDDIDMDAILKGIL